MLADYIKPPQPPTPRFGPPPATLPANHVSPTPPKPQADPIPLQMMIMHPDGRPVTEYQDRYEFSPGDSGLWLQLFGLADLLVGEPMASLLMYIRNTGALLVPSAKYGYMIQPVIGVQGWASMAEYERERQPLLKYTDELVRCLKQLRRDDGNGDRVSGVG